VITAMVGQVRLGITLQVAALDADGTGHGFLEDTGPYQFSPVLNLDGLRDIHGYEFHGHRLTVQAEQASEQWRTRMRPMALRCRVASSKMCYQ